MAASVAFDPSSAKPVGFDPSSAKPIQNLLGTSEAAQRGILVGGLQGVEDLADLARAPFKLAGSLIPPLTKIPVVGDVFSPENKLPPAESLIPGKTISALHPIATDVGKIASSALPIGTATAKIAPEASRLAAPIGRALSPLLPGALNKAKAAGEAASQAGRTLVEKATSEIAPVTDVSTVGRDILSETRPKWQTLLETRDKKVKDAINRLGALRGNAEQEQLAAERVYRTQSSDINKFMNNGLGKKIARNAGRYASDAEKQSLREAALDASDVAKQSFKSAESVRDLRELFGGDQKKVEKYAADYVSQHIYTMTYGQDAETAAKNVGKFLVSNRDWLAETPKTRDAIQAYKTVMDSHVAIEHQIVKTQEAIKKTRTIAARAELGGLTLALFYGGYHAWSWARRALGL